jgi:hypothetical protein
LLEKHTGKDGKVDILGYASDRYKQLIAMAELINLMGEVVASDSGAVKGHAAKFKAYFEFVRDRGPGDIKHELYYLAELQGSARQGEKGQMLFEQDGKLYDADDIGNFGAGYLAEVAGLSGDEVRFFGGLAQVGSDIWAHSTGAYVPNRSPAQIADEFVTGLGQDFSPVGFGAAFDEAPDRAPVQIGGIAGNLGIPLSKGILATLTVDYFDKFR